MYKTCLFLAWMMTALPGSVRAADMGKDAFQSLLQGFVGQAYQKSFRHLGDERDFDHGHVLSGADGNPVAVMWHTQELALYEPEGGEYGYVNAQGRNWLQWLSDGRVENADRYERKSYPSGAAWDWFRAAELPGLRKNHTILDKMLDPELVSIDPAKTVQYVFTRVDCGRAAPAPDAAEMRVVLPSRESVCLSLSR